MNVTHHQGQVDGTNDVTLLQTFSSGALVEYEEPGLVIGELFTIIRNVQHLLGADLPVHVRKKKMCQLKSVVI